MANRTLLLVEDDAAISEMYVFRLEAEGWQVALAADGESAIGYLQQAVPRAVLLDIMLPGVDGIGVLEYVRGNDETRDLPVLVVSNSPGLGGSLERAQELGVAGWRIKSQLTPTALAGEVRRLVGDPTA